MQMQAILVTWTQKFGDETVGLINLESMGPLCSMQEKVRVSEISQEED